MATAIATPRPRLVSLDQFRGYTVAGMVLVNYLGSFAVCPAVLKHHNCYCSYADTIMPQFLFAVGFAFRLTFGRRVQSDGRTAAYLRIVRRLLGLMVLSLVLYSLNGIPPHWHPIGEMFKRYWFQTLMHIAVTSLWILPVIQTGTAVRVAFLIASGILHVALSAWFNFAWVNCPPTAIDGGPLGFLTWAIPALVGTFACDAVTAREHPPRVGRMLAWSFALMIGGYLLSCGTRFYDMPQSGATATAARLADDPVAICWGRGAGRPVTTWFAELPFVPPPATEERAWNYWMMSQRSGSVSYLTFAAGFALAVFVLFHVACDRGRWQLGLFRTLGSNALAAYVLHGFLNELVKPFIPRDANLAWVASGFAISFGGTYLVVRQMEKRGLFLRM